MQHFSAFKSNLPSEQRFEKHSMAILLLDCSLFCGAFTARTMIFQFNGQNHASYLCSSSLEFWQGYGVRACLHIFAMHSTFG